MNTKMFDPVLARLRDTDEEYIGTHFTICRQHLSELQERVKLDNTTVEIIGYIPVDTQCTHCLTERLAGERLTKL